MSLSQAQLAAIQQAGQALHHATQVISDSVRSQAQNIVALVANQPFKTDSEQAFAQFRMLAQLNQDLQSMELQLRDLYATAETLSNPALDVIGEQRRLTALTAGNTTAEDAVVKPARNKRKTARSAGPSAQADKASVGAKSANPTPNDTKVLQFLQSALNTESWTALTGATIARGAGLPMGSVGISLNKVLASGAVIKGARGLYRLP